VSKVPRTCAEAKAANEAAFKAIEAFLDEDEPSLITHELCGGMVAEHYFTGIDSDGYLTGFPTGETLRLDVSPHVAIAPCNVTHIDRIPIRNLPDVHHLSQEDVDDAAIDRMCAEREALEQGPIKRLREALAQRDGGDLTGKPIVGNTVRIATEDLRALLDEIDPDVPF
jgi:hypothetical protein